MMGRWLDRLIGNDPSQNTVQNVQNVQNAIERGRDPAGHRELFSREAVQNVQNVQNSGALPENAGIQQPERDKALSNGCWSVASLLSALNKSFSLCEHIAALEAAGWPRPAAALQTLAEQLADAAPDLPAVLAADADAALRWLPDSLAAMLATAAGQRAAWVMLDRCGGPQTPGPAEPLPPPAAEFPTALALPILLDRLRWWPRFDGRVNRWIGERGFSRDGAELNTLAAALAKAGPTLPPLPPASATAGAVATLRARLVTTLAAAAGQDAAWALIGRADAERVRR